jgi:hypothetical protein
VLDSTFQSAAARLGPALESFKKSHKVGYRVAVIVSLLAGPLIGLILLPYAAYALLKIEAAEAILSTSSFSTFKKKLFWVILRSSVILVAFYMLIGFVRTGGNPDGLASGMGVGLVMMVAADIGFISAAFSMSRQIKNEKRA